MRKAAGARLLPIFLSLAFAATAAETALDRYVKTPDPAYKYELVKTVPGDGYTTYVIELTSQTWRKPEEVDRTVWKHWLIVVKPDKIQGTTGYLFITGGSVNDKMPDKIDDPTFVDNALTTHTVVAELQDVQNESLVFKDENRRRSEDAIIAYAQVKYLATADPSWILRLPMTKSAVRAMDTITSFLATPAAGNVKVEKFVVSGGSKRGWTTWTTAAVDKRVVAIIQMSIDMLNLEKSFEHHYRVYGFWAPAVKDYVEAGLMDWNGTPEYEKMLDIEEPYRYRDRLTLPKFIVNAAGDQFFLPDSSRFYFDDLKGEKYLRYLPNTNHHREGTDYRESNIAFYEAILHGTPRPHFTWKFESNGDIRVVSKDKPSAVKLWQATDPDHRDFRLMTIGPAYKSSELEDQGGGVYVAHVDPPAKGWTAFLVEMTYPSGGKYPFKFTTGVRITPDTEPFPPYQPKRPVK